MPFNKIDIKDFNENIFTKIANEWFLITAGKPEHCNTMTACWGSFGVLWGRNVATVYVRKGRYTYEFMEDNDLFTLSFFGENNCRDALNLCGSRSGREMDKIAAAGLTKEELAGTTTFAEADTVVVCKKLFTKGLPAEEILDPAITKSYAENEDWDYHYMYIGEIVGIYKK